MYTCMYLCIYVYMYQTKWCHGVLVKHAVSQHRGNQFDSSMCHFKNSIGEEGNGKPTHKTHFPRKKLRALSLVSAMLKIEYATQQYQTIMTCLKQG